jgi:hypothetical protein
MTLCAQKLKTHRVHMSDAAAVCAKRKAKSKLIAIDLYNWLLFLNYCRSMSRNTFDLNIPVFGGRCNLKDCRLVAQFCGKVEEDVAAVTELGVWSGLPTCVAPTQINHSCCRACSCLCVFCGLHGFIVANGYHSALVVTAWYKANHSLTYGKLNKEPL